MEISHVTHCFNKLQRWIEKENYAGWDPYDGLNSQLFQSSPFRFSSFFRLAWIQFFKRNPVNLRKITGVKKGYNAKGLGLFLSGYCNLYQFDPTPEHLTCIRFLIDKLLTLEVKNYSGSCWGYNFDWQARAFFQPKNTPTIVATTYVAHSFLDAYALLKEKSLLEKAKSSCDFILNDLNRTYNSDHDFCFSYSPLDHTQIYNASFLGSRLLLRVYHHTQESTLRTQALQAARYCCKGQKEDGSWPYGTLPYHQWVDNFHTGFNLECLSDIIRYSQESSFHPYLNRGLAYYLSHFFTSKGESKFHNDQLYPIDIHAPAQLLVTLCRLGVLEKNRILVDHVLTWTLKNMQDRRGYFYYRVGRFMRYKIPYIRWAQAWMFYGLTHFLKQTIHELSQQD